MREQFPHLRHGNLVNVIIHVMLLRRVPFAAAGRAAVVPVLRLRIIESKLDAVFFAGGGQFLQRIAMKRRRLHDVPRTGFRVEHREAVVMLGGDDDVFHAGVFGESSPRHRR